METSSKKRSASVKNDHSNSINHCKKKKTSSSSSSNINDSPIAGTRITDWEEYEKWKEVRGDIEPTMNYVEITPEAIEELRKIKNIIGDYICQLCKIKYENAFALAMHKCPRVVHIEFRCPECDKTFNCPANLASHRRWHKPQPSNGSTIPTTSTPKSHPSKQPRCSSRSDSRSTNTSSSTTASDTVHEYSTISSTMDLSQKRIQHETSDQIFRAIFNGNSSRMISPSFSNSYLKQPMIFPHSRSLPMNIPSAFDFRRLQSSCIFCHEQFSELNHLFQHIRKNHAVTSSTNSKNINLALDKIVF